jgi:hypothetical protein
MRLRYRDRLDEAIYNTELPPQIVLSEGQLAANGFSILCAASTAYPWSSCAGALVAVRLDVGDDAPVRWRHRRVMSRQVPRSGT